MATALTERQNQILLYIVAFTRNHGFPPTLREMAQHFEIAPSSVLGHLWALQSKGYIRRHKAKPRCLEVLRDVA